MSWFGNLSRWFRRSSERASEEACTDSRLQDLRRDLEAEQRGLASDLEGLFLAYDERMRGMSSRLVSMDDAALDREWESVRSQQREIRRVLQRFETSVRSRQELERELVAWESRKDGEERAEMIRSELALRGVKRADRLPAPRAENAPMRRSVLPEEGEDYFMEIPLELLRAAQLPEAELYPLRSEDVIAAIRDAVREAERWHAVPEEAMGEDALLQLHHVRDLHGMLRRLDRQNGVRRDRTGLSVSPRALKILVDA